MSLNSTCACLARILLPRVDLVHLVFVIVTIVDDRHIHRTVGLERIPHCPTFVSSLRSVVGFMQLPTYAKWEDMEECDERRKLNVASDELSITLVRAKWHPRMKREKME
jgi:hypothetical protein